MEQKVALVTGGIGGIGSAIVDMFAEKGYRVYASALPQDPSNGVKGQAGQTNYSAAKAGLIGFTKALAQEVASRGITVNAIAPGYVATDMVAKIKPEILQTIIDSVPMRRLATPEEIAGCVEYLASDKAAYITGAVLNINGGLHM